MSALGGSQDQQEHRIDGGGADSAAGFGSDSAASGEPAAAARVKLADHLRATGRADAAVSAAFLAVPRHAFLPRM